MINGDTSYLSVLKIARHYIENITSFGGIYHIIDVFSKLGFKKLTESVLGKRGSSGKAFSHGSIFGSFSKENTAESM